VSARDCRAGLIDSLRLVVRAIVRQPALAERERLGLVFEEGLAGLLLLERRGETHRSIAHLRKLESQLAHMPPGELASAIQVRMRISRTRYYELRNLSGIQSGRKSGLPNGLIKS
jgi:hypothetical protein